jgi:hypothetical protein
MMAPPLSLLAYLQINLNGKPVLVSIIFLSFEAKEENLKL